MAKITLRTKLMYKIWGKQIQQALERTERATRESVEFGMKNERLQILDEYLRSPQFEKDCRAKMAQFTYTVNPDDVISAIADGTGKAAVIKLGNDTLTKQQVKNLKEEVVWFKRTHLHSIFLNTLKDKAQKVMFRDSTTFEDMRGGKMMLLSLDIIGNILKSIESFDTKK